MSNQIGLARIFRPDNFEDGFTGQEAVAKSLIYALDTGKVSQGMLFSGERGCGKTTSGRIVSKGLNCIKGVTSKPCGTCEYCKNDHMLYTEIDAATNRGIEDVRRLQESIRYAVPPGKHRVYVIDEVHMMSDEAFNAFLKTLEEPPENVYFILCTTEPNKLPATVLSRLQHFEFKKIPVILIKKRLVEILEKEEFTNYTDDAITVIAQQANGGMRDALTLLEQCLLLNQTLTADTVYELIGTVEHTNFLELLKSISCNDLETALDLTTNLKYEVQPKLFYQGFAQAITHVILKRAFSDRGKKLVKEINLSRETLIKMADIIQKESKSNLMELTVINLFDLPEIKQVSPQNNYSIKQEVAATVEEQKVEENNSVNTVTQKVEVNKQNNEVKSKLLVHSALAYTVFAS